MDARRIPITALVLVAPLIACQPDPPPLAEPTVPLSIAEPQIFAAQVVSTEAPEFATAFSTDGATVYFNRADADRSELKIYRSTLDNGVWTPPTALPFSDGTYRDLDPFVDSDGRLYFSSNRPLQGSEPKDFDLWYAEMTDTGWGTPVNLGPPVNTADSEIFSSLARNGNLYYGVYRADDSQAIYRAQWRDGAYQEPEELSLPLPAGATLGNPCIAPDESFLLVSSDSLEGLGASDLFVTRRGPDSRWSKPENLGPAVNSPFADFAPALGPDGETLFFTSERPGIVPAGAVEGRPPGDIFELRWTAPEAK